LAEKFSDKDERPSNGKINSEKKKLAFPEEEMDLEDCIDLDY
jgi:hypothetical protein